MKEKKYTMNFFATKFGISQADFMKYAPILTAYKKLYQDANEDLEDAIFIMSLEEMYRLFDIPVEDHITEKLANLIHQLNIWLAEDWATTIIAPNH